METCYCAQGTGEQSMMTLILVIAIVAVVVYLFVTKDTPHNDIDDWDNHD